MEPIIEVSGLRKSYGTVQAVKGIDFTVEKGSLFAFLGPNGAGKSTTMDMICTFLQPDEGEVRVNGHRLGREDAMIRSDIGAVFQDSLLDPLLTVKENLSIRGSFYRMKSDRLEKAVLQAAEAADITDLLKRPYGKLSGGQRRRCDIARALVHTPKILFLDEPTTGLDPQTRKQVWDTLRAIQRRTGMTVFLTTHYMEEAADADYVVVIAKGEITAKGSPAELRDRYTSDRAELIAREPDALEQLLLENGERFVRIADRFVIRVANTMDALPVLERYRQWLTGFEVKTGTMDEAFIAVCEETGHEK